MIFKVSNLRKSFLYLIQGPKFYGGSPSTPSNTTQTVNQNSIPEQLLPYTQTMMGAAENQIYQKDASGAVTGFQPYKPYSANASDYVAPFSPLQQQAQHGAANLQAPNNFGVASNIAGQAGIGNLGTADTAAQFGAQGYQSGQLGQNIGVAGGAGTAQQALNYGGQGANIGMGSSLSSANQAGQQQAQAQGYGAQGSQMGQNAANVGATGGLGYGAQSANLGMMAANQAGQGYNAGANFAQQATDPNAVNAYMSPYLQNVMNQQIGAANRQYDISGTEQQGRATQAGAFGGSREALMASENERNRNTAIGGIQATGYQNAFTNAQAQQAKAADLGLQGMNAGNQTIQTGLQGIGQGITGVNTALQGYQQGISGAQAGLSGVGAQTNASQMQQAGTGQALQGVGYGLQGVTGAQAGIQQQLAGTAQGIVGAQAGLEGVSGQQAGYAGAGQAAGTLGNLGTQGLAAQTSVLGTQAAAGATQQAQQQQAIDQAVLDYKNAQQKPLSDIGLMSDLIRGTPIANSGSTVYQAQPSAISQIGGLAATGIGAYGALKANGGVIKDRGYANGGIVGYNGENSSVVSSVEAQLNGMDDAHLQNTIQTSTSQNIKELAIRILNERKASNMANGGIVGYNGEKGSSVEDKKSDEWSEENFDPVWQTLSVKNTPKYKDLYRRLGYKGVLNKATSNVGEGATETVKAIADAPSKIADASSKIASKIVNNIGWYGEENRPQPTSAGNPKAITTAVDTQTPNNIVNTQQPAPTENPKAITAAAPVNTTPAANITQEQAAKLGPMSTNQPLNQLAKNQEDVQQAAKQGINVTQGTPTTTQSQEDSVLSRLQASSDLAEKEATMPMEKRIQDQKDLEEKFAGKDTETAAYRKSIMDERANAPDEARRQMYMRLMEFGANWGSTPGAPLAAGLKAITSTLPGLMEDTKANKKMMRELNRAEYDLNHASRLEELGHIKEATAAKDKANDLFMKHDDKIVAYGLAQQKIQSAEKIAEAELANRITTTGMTNDASIRTHQITAAAVGKGDKSATENARIAARENALRQAVIDAGDEDKLTDAEGKEISKSVWVKNRTAALENYFLNVQPAAEQPKQTPNIVPLPSVGTVRNGYKYLGGDINKDSSWSKI